MGEPDALAVGNRPFPLDADDVLCTRRVISVPFILSLRSGTSRSGISWPSVMTVKSLIRTGPARTCPTPMYPLRVWWTKTRAPG